MRLFRVFAAAMALIGSPVAAQEPASQADRIAAEIDRYLQNPRSAETYRALANLGDPTFLAEAPPYRSGWDSALLGALEMSYTDCRWRYSDEIYRKRLARFGEGHAYLRQWLAVQRAVFSRCHGYEEKAGDPIPPALAVRDPEVARLQAEDRAYQRAAALFYEDKRAEARAAFAALAARRGEHQAAAKLMVASIDAGSEPDGYTDKANPAAVARAERLIKDPAAKPMQANAHELVGWIGATADTREARRAQVKVTLEALALPLEAIRGDEQAAARYHRSSEDLLALFTDFDDDGWWLSGAVPSGYYGSLAMAEAARTNPLAAFALTQRPVRGEASPRTDRQVEEAAQAQFDAGRGDRDAWRVVLLQLSSFYQQPATSWPEIDGLLARIAARPTDHDVALLGFLFDYQQRYAFDGSYIYDEAEKRRGRAVAMAKLAAYPYKQSDHFQRLYSHALNALIGLQDIAAARRLRDLVEPQLKDENSWLVDSDLLLLLAEDEAAMVKVIAERGAGESTLLNRLPARRLARLAEDPRLDAKVRTRFARVAWTRDYVLGRKTDKRLDATMRALNPAIASGWKAKAGAKASDPQLLLDVLGTPGMNLRVESRTAPTYGPADEVESPLQIDVYEHSRNNWWCRPDAVQQSGREEDELAGSVEQIARGTLETLLAKSHLWQSLDPQERAALSAVPNGAQYLSGKSIAWARKVRPNKPRGADEALALAVKATRYGCQFNGGHGAYSKAAWELLHSKFPDSPAARRTRWWFDCKHFTYGCSDSTKDDQSYVDMAALEAELKREEEAREASDPPR